jgi:hypothetical protein
MSEVKVNKISPRTNCGTVTLGDSGDTFSIPAGVTLTNSGTATGFGPTGAVSWNTTKITADPNPAVSGVGYFADTTSSAFTVTLPAAPSAGDIVALSDYTGTWTTNNVTVGRNSSNINGAASDLILNGNNTTATLIYVDGTEGWRVIDTGSLSEVNIAEYIAATGGTESTCGDYKIHTFTGPGTFTVTNDGNPLGSSTVDYLVVAGGGGGGGSTGGGGGAGGFRQSSGTASGCYSVSPLGSGVSALPVTATGYPITVGSGGAAGSAPCASGGTPGSDGNNSVFSTITSTGGGGGGGYAGPVPASGRPGGSGGGVGQPCGAGETGGLGNTPPVSPPQGQPGVPFPSSPTPGGAGTGGGGAIAAGTLNGGAGAGTNINTATGEAGPGPSRYYAGGGGSSRFGGTGGSGGIGGGGDGVSCGTGGGQPGTANTGGGAGGGDFHAGTAGAGGSGIVIIRYKFQ